MTFVAYFMHDLHLIHTDLKPENILVSSEYIEVLDYKFLSRSAKNGSYLKNLPKSSAIKLIDFGSNTFESQDHSYVVSTHHHAPEVILGLGWNYPCDMWRGTFPNSREPGTSGYDGKGFGAIASTYDDASRAEIYFRRGAMLDWPEGATSRKSMRAVWKLP